jgi:hypothetical protein
MAVRYRVLIDGDVVAEPRVRTIALAPGPNRHVVRVVAAARNGLRIVGPRLVVRMAG